MAQSPSSSPVLAGTNLIFEPLHTPYKDASLTTLPALHTEASSSAPVQSPHSNIRRPSRAISSISSPAVQGTGALNVLNNPPAPSFQPTLRSSPTELSKFQLPTHRYPISRITRTRAEQKAQYNAIPPSARSQYMRMLLALDDIPLIYSICASGFTWILLAGFILLPATLTKALDHLKLGNGVGANLGNGVGANLGNGVGAQVVDRIAHLPWFVVAFACTGIGCIGMIFLWWRWMNNYIWLINKVFLPGLMNALAGIISALTNIYGSHHGEITTNSIITISVTGGVFIIFVALVVLYQFVLLRLAKKRHQRDIGVEKAGKHGEGVWTAPKSKSVS